MKNTLLVIAVVGGVVGCSDNVPSNCVVKEAIIKNGPLISGKLVFTHDGTNYTGSRAYLYDPITSKYELQPASTAEYSYYDDGRIAQAKYYANSNDTFDQHEYSYTDGHITFVADRYRISRRNIMRFDTTYRFHYIESPQDSTYRFDDIAEDYKNGNMVRLGFVRPDRTIKFQFTYTYDHFPNIVGDFVFHNLIPTRNFGHTRNNIVKETSSDSPETFSKKQSFAYYGNGQLNQWTFHDTGRVVSFIYDCK